MVQIRFSLQSLLWFDGVAALSAAGFVFSLKPVLSPLFGLPESLLATQSLIGACYAGWNGKPSIPDQGRRPRADQFFEIRYRYFCPRKYISSPTMAGDASNPSLRVLVARTFTSGPDEMTCITPSRLST